MAHALQSCLSWQPEKNLITKHNSFLPQILIALGPGRIVTSWASQLFHSLPCSLLSASGPPANSAFHAGANLVEMRLLALGRSQTLPATRLAFAVQTLEVLITRLQYVNLAQRGKSKTWRSRSDAHYFAKVWNQTTVIMACCLITQSRNTSKSPGKIPPSFTLQIPTCSLPEKCCIALQFLPWS